MKKKKMTKFDYEEEIKRLNKILSNKDLQVWGVIRYSFEELLETMDKEGVHPSDHWGCRDWWIANVKSKSLHLHLSFVKELKHESEWRFRTPPLFIPTEEQMVERYGPRKK